MTRRPFNSWRWRRQPVTVCTKIDQKRRAIHYTTMSEEDWAKLPPPIATAAAFPPREWWIERAPLLANRLLRMPWQARKRDLEDWRKRFLAVEWPRGPWHEDRRPKCAPRKVDLRVTVMRRKELDPDNAAIVTLASLKNLLDALRSEGWLYDDSPEWLRVDVEPRTAKRCRTVITWRLAR